MAASRALPGVELVLDGAAAAARFELPLDLEGDFVVLGDAGTVVGAARAEHDLSGLAGHRLRSHGGMGEENVPFMVSHRLRPDYLADAQARGGLRNFDIFDAVLNAWRTPARMSATRAWRLRRVSRIAAVPSKLSEDLRRE